MKPLELKIEDPELANTLSEKPSISGSSMDKERVAIKSGTAFRNKLLVFISVSGMCGLFLVQHNMLVNEKMVSEMLRKEIHQIRKFGTIKESEAPGSNFETRPLELEPNPKADSKPIGDLNTDCNTETRKQNLDSKEEKESQKGQEVSSKILDKSLDSEKECKNLTLSLVINSTNTQFRISNEETLGSLGLAKVEVSFSFGEMKPDKGGLGIDMKLCRFNDMPNYVNNDDDDDNDNDNDNLSGDGSGDSKKAEVEPSKSSGWFIDNYNANDDFYSEFLPSQEISRTQINLENQPSINLESQPSTNLKNQPSPAEILNENNIQNMPKPSNVSGLYLVTDTARIEHLKRLRYYLQGDIYWKIANETTDSKTYFKFDEVISTITALSAGYYRITAQFTFAAKTSKKWAFAIKVNGLTRTTCRVEEDYFMSSSFRSMEGATIDAGLNPSQALTLHRPCSTSLTIYLTPHDAVELECIRGCKDIQYEADFTYWRFERINSVR